MDFTKYDRVKVGKKDPEAGFTAADYDDHKRAPGIHPGWMASSAVIRLIEYLRKHQSQGIILYERFGNVGLKFEPGIKGADIRNGRAQLAMKILVLLDEAQIDLKSMIAAGVDIPLMIHYQVEPSLIARTPVTVATPAAVILPVQSADLSLNLAITGGRRVLPASVRNYGNSNPNF